MYSAVDNTPPSKSVLTVEDQSSIGMCIVGLISLEPRARSGMTNENDARAIRAMYTMLALILGKDASLAEMDKIQKAVEAHRRQNS